MEIQGITLGAVVLILIKELMSSFSDKHRKNTLALEAATHAIIKLEGKIENIIEKLDEIPQIKKDVNEAHQKLREIKTKLDGSLSS